MWSKSINAKSLRNLTLGITIQDNDPIKIYTSSNQLYKNLVAADLKQIECARKFVQKLTANYYPEKFTNPGTLMY